MTIPSNETLSALAAEYGTPLWIYDAAAICRRITQLSAFDVIRYAQKACSNIHILEEMRKAGVRVDAVSLGEIERAKRAGFSGGNASGAAEIQHGLAADPRLEALLLWTNCRSAVEAAKIASVPTIFNEVGPLRPPVYHPTAYFDFGGLHDQAQALARWNNFNARSKAASLPVLDRSSLCSLLRRAPVVERSDKRVGFVGIALQYPGGAHLKYSADFTNDCFIDLATRHCKGKAMVRPHPGARISSSARSIACDESNTAPH